jgi:phosphatidylglycerophosphate synthase
LLHCRISSFKLLQTYGIRFHANSSLATECRKQWNRSLNAGNIEPSGRRDELSDWFNHRIFHPLARRLAVTLVHSSVTPNQLSIAGGLCVVLAGLCYTVWGGPAGAIFGFGLHLAWHVFDGADGDLARLTNRASPFGEAVDGISDYFSHIALYCMFGVTLAQIHGPAIWLLLIGAGVSRIFQTSHQEERRREYEYWIYGRSWIRNDGFHPKSTVERWMAALVIFYLSVSDRTSDGAGTIETLHRQAASDSLSLAAFRDVARRNLRPLLVPLQMLGSNQRTIALGVAMILGQAHWYFVYELVLLNCVLLWSIRTHASAARQVAREFKAAEPGQVMAE